MQFGPVFYQLYHNPNYKGRVARQFLQPPMTAYKYDKSLEGSPRVNIHLPPRVSFRYCASYKFVTYFCLGALLAWLLGYRLDTYLFMLAFIIVCYRMLKAIPKDSQSHRHGYPTQGFGNISFNDSF